MILDEILANKRHEVDARRTRRRSVRPLLPADRVRGDSGLVIAGHVCHGDLFEALRQPGVSFIAEIKRKSPSGGELRPDLSPRTWPRCMQPSGAVALSVLTDQRYFGGSDADLTAAQHASGLPALRKDFVIDPYQILEARELGADAVLLIVRALSDALLRELLELTHACGMEALVETHSAPKSSAPWPLARASSA